MRFRITFFICMILYGMGSSSQSAQQVPDERDINPPPIKRADPVDENKLSRYIYFIDRNTRKLTRLDWRETNIQAVNIDENLGSGSGTNNMYKYTSHTFPGADGTGNRFLVLYRPEGKGFKVYDKITGHYDRLSFHRDNPSGYRIGKIYPVDYTEMGNSVFSLFFMVGRGPDADADKLECIYKNKLQDITRYVLEPSILGHYYNPSEKKLIWLEQSGTGPGFLKAVLYYVPEQNRREFTIRVSADELPRILMSTYDFIGIRLIKQQPRRGNRDTMQKMEHCIFKAGISRPLLKFNDSTLFCHTVDDSNLYILVSDKTGVKKRLRFFHYNSELDAESLVEKSVPQKVNQFLSGKWDNVVGIFYLSHGSTFYVCVITQIGPLHQYKLFRLTDNFKHTQHDKNKKSNQVQGFPQQYFKNGNLEFSAKEGMLFLKDTAGGIVAVGIVNQKDDLQFYPK